MPPYSQFLGYDKHPDDPKIGFIVNEEEAKLVKRIYKEFLRGKSPSAISRMLEAEGIKSPTGRDTWHASTVRSILTNEKYKGDAHIRKTYVKDFLTHELVKNNGEVESFYVKKHHEPIINPNEWETVQAELKKRKTVGSTNNYINAFSGRVVCADCGTSYGPKIWHSTSKYRREVYQCNAKFRNRCKTPTLTEDEIKGLFLKAYSQFMGNKAQVIEDTEEMIQILCDTTKLQKDIETLTTKAEDIVVLAENLITRNATQAMNPDEFERRYEEYDTEHNQLIEKITKKQNQIKERKSKAICLKAFIKELRERETILNEFDEMVWSYLIEKATVNRDGSVSFLFRNGVTIKSC